MSGKSVHREVALWRYEKPSRGYFGLHLRAQTAEARSRLTDRLEALAPGRPHLFRFGGQIADTQPWKHVPYGEALLTLNSVPVEGDGLSLGIAADQLEDLIGLLRTVSVQHESSVTVTTAEGAAPLWVWWDP